MAMHGSTETQNIKGALHGKGRELSGKATHQPGAGPGFNSWPVHIPTNSTHWVITQLELVHLLLDQTQILKMNQYWNHAYIWH